MNRRRSISTICASARLIALAILFGGSAAIVFAAITFVKVAQAHGMTVPQAASYNAPVFLGYSKIALAAAIVLIAAVLARFFLLPERSTLAGAIGYAAVGGCFVATVTFSMAILPAMEKLMPQLAENTTAYEAFHRLHHWSESCFASIILFALVALIAPTFKSD